MINKQNDFTHLNTAGKGTYRGIPVEITETSITFNFKNSTDLTQFLANIRFENHYHCAKCKHTFFAARKTVRVDDYDEYYVTCPNCSNEMYVGNNCYWR